MFGNRFKVTDRLLQVAAAEHTIFGEEYNHKSPTGDLSLLELLIQKRRADVAAAITEEVCLVAASVSNRRALDLLAAIMGSSNQRNNGTTWQNSDMKSSIDTHGE